MPQLFFSKDYSVEKPSAKQTLAILPFFAIASTAIATVNGAVGYSVLSAAQNSTISDVDFLKAVQIMVTGAAVLSPLELIATLNLSAIEISSEQFLPPIFQPANIQEILLHAILNIKDHAWQEQSYAYRYANPHEVLIAALLSIGRAAAFCAAQGLTGAAILDMLHGDQTREKYIASMGVTGYGVVMAGILGLFLVTGMAELLGEVAFCGKNYSTQMLKLPENVRQPLHDILSKILAQANTARLTNEPTPFSSRDVKQSRRLAVS